MSKTRMTTNGRAHKTQPKLVNGHRKTETAETLRLTRRTSTDAHLKLAERASADMRELLTGKSGELVRVLELNEETSRKVVAAELDLCREHELHTRLAGDLARLEKETEEVRAENAQVTKKRDALAEESQRLRKQVDVATREGGKLADDVESMAKELKELQAENAGLHARRAKLGEDIARLKKLRQEYLANISKLKADKDDLAA